MSLFLEMQYASFVFGIIMSQCLKFFLLYFLESVGLRIGEMTKLIRLRFGHILRQLVAVCRLHQRALTSSMIQPTVTSRLHWIMEATQAWRDCRLEVVVVVAVACVVAGNYCISALFMYTTYCKLLRCKDARIATVETKCLALT